MSDGILAGLRIVEGSAFVAAPLGGMTLAQLGADVIRFDDIPGGLDYRRWPLAAGGQSLFWAGLNKGKRSIRIDIRKPEGRELVTALITAPGPHAGLFLTNFPPRGWLAYDALRARRSDLVMVSLTGNPDGSSEVDYTVNPATGFPWATGPRSFAEPLNSVLPAWDAIWGASRRSACWQRNVIGHAPGRASSCGSLSLTWRLRWSATSAASPRPSSAPATKGRTATTSTARSGTTSRPAMAAASWWWH